MIVCPLGAFERGMSILSEPESMISCMVLTSVVQVLLSVVTVLVVVACVVVSVDETIWVGRDTLSAPSRCWS